MKIRKRKTLGMTIVELLPPISIAFTLASMLLPALGKAKNKANRVKCSSNLSQIARGFNGFAADEATGDYPWMLTQRTLNAIYDNTPRGTAGRTWGTGNWWHCRNIEHMWTPESGDLGSIKTLLSPCDPGTKPSNQEAYARAISSERGDAMGCFAGNNKVENHAQSYAVHKGVSVLAPGTILAMTKNFVGADARKVPGTKLMPMQPYDRNGDGQYDPVSPGNSWGVMSRMADSVYYRNDAWARDKGVHQMVYTSIPREIDYDGWDRYLCRGNNDKLYHDKNGNGQHDPGDIMANGFIGPDVDPKATYLRAHEPLKVFDSLAMMGLQANQGQVVMAHGGVSQANDRTLQEHIHETASLKGNHIHPLEVLSQPTRQVRP